MSEIYSLKHTDVKLFTLFFFLDWLCGPKPPHQSHSSVEALSCTCFSRSGERAEPLSSNRTSSSAERPAGLLLSKRRTSKPESLRAAVPKQVTSWKNPKPNQKSINQPLTLETPS